MSVPNFPDYRDDLRSISSGLAKEIPDTYAAYRRLSGAAMAEGAVSAKQKELIALGISIAVHCDGCISAHVHGALKNGATRAEIAETIAVAINMGGGPATVYAAHAWAALEQYETPLDGGATS